jgi:gamma-D-glutamyl-L-lysine dipeptidyl-peptidase
MAAPPPRGTIGRLAVVACAPATALAIAWPAAAGTGSAATPARAVSAAATAAPGSSAAASPPSAYVDVSVATVWTAPTSPRPVDQPALANPVNIPRWLSDMSLADKLGLTTDNLTQTQALYGNRVYILAQQPGWDEVAVPGQPTPKNPLGYPGWIPSVQLTAGHGFAALQSHRPFALVQAPTAWLYDNSALTRETMQISAGTRLPVLDRAGQAIRVATPGGGTRWLSARDATVYRSARDIPYPTGASLVAYAERFLHVPYLWAGRSGFAFDCSGFTSLIYQVNGITIPRDAGAQAQYGGGRMVSTNDLQPGDLLFYATSPDPASIYHVAMYIGHQQMIEAYDAATPVRITAVRFGPDYWGAERFLRPGAGSSRRTVVRPDPWVRARLVGVTRSGEHTLPMA